MVKRSLLPTGVLRYATTKAKQATLRRAPKPVIHRLRVVQKWMRKKRLRQTTAGGFPAVSSGTLLATPNREPHFHFVVGCILDEFSFAAWGAEFELVALQPGETVPQIDFLLVESAWAGNSGAWSHQLTGEHAPSENLRDIIRECNARGVPTVFWNKEDPAHFEDFHETAGMFDYIATTDSNMLSQYQRLHPDSKVFLLPFAAQPALQNPARNTLPDDPGDIAFAGTYFRHKFQERRQQMDLLLGAAHRLSQQSDAKFTIFSRHAGGDSKYQFPAKWSKHVVGSLPYPEMLSAYRSFKVFLNVNSVTTSPSMCARRIFEISASGTPVISTESAALRSFFSPEEVPTVNSSEGAELTLRAFLNSNILRRRTAHLALRRVWQEHTYRHRAQVILQHLGLVESVENIPSVSVICSTNRDPRLSHLLQQVAAQSLAPVELCVLGHGIEIDEDFYTRARAMNISSVKILHRESSESLGSCLNALVESASGEIIAKFDDDDYYLPNYLLDQTNALINMDADLVGKGSIYFYLPDLNVIARRWKHQEHIWRNFVAGATFVGWKQTFTETPSADRTQGEDSDFLARLDRKGRKVYSSDSFNYLCIRGSTAHTWSISDAEILANSEIETIGKNIEHVEV